MNFDRNFLNLDTRANITLLNLWYLVLRLKAKGHQKEMSKMKGDSNGNL